MQERPGYAGPPFMLATVAVPIVIYGLMPHLHRLRARLLPSH
jgi:hypothetical protein